MKKAKQNFINLFIVIVGLTNVFGGAALPAWGATLFVCDTCSPYNSITSALTDAVRGDIVYVAPGDYYENIALTSEVNVVGSGAEVTRIIGANYIDAPPDVVQAVDVLNAKFSGFTIDLAPDPAGIPPIATSRAFWVESSSLTISRNVIRHSGSSRYPSTGVFAVGSPAAVIKNNVFYPKSRGGYGVNIGISAPVVKNNIIMNYETGISTIAGSDPPVTGYNNIFDCAVNYSDVAPGSGVLSLSPLFVDPADGDFHLRHDSPCRDTGDPADPVPDHGGSRIDMGVFEYLLPAIVEGPAVEILACDEVEIVWQTSVPADSAVGYEQYAGSPEEVSETDLTEIHDIILTGLTPSTTYRYVVKSTDVDGNQVESEPAYFGTCAEADYDPPWLEVAMPDVIGEPVWVDVEAFDNVGVEKIEYFVNDELVHTAFGDKFDWQFDPADFVNGHYLVRVCAHDKAGGSSCQELPVDVYVRPVDTSPPTITVASPTPGVTVSGPSVEIEIVSMDLQSGIEKIVFFVDDEQLHVVQVNGSPGEDEQVSWSWNSFGASSGDLHEIKVQIFNNDGIATEQIVDVNVSNITMPPQWFNNYKFIQLTRGQVKREEVYYEAKLYVKNISSEIFYDVVVEDYHAGFQAIQSDYGHQPRVRFDSNLKSSVVTYSIGNLMPGEQKECTIYMSTVLIGASPSLFDYKIGKQTDVTYSRLVESEYQETTFHYAVPAIKTIEGWWGVNDIPLTTQNVLAPVINRDYLVVTHPRRLYALYNDDNVDALLSELAEFVDDKNAVLGYLNSTNPKLELLKATNHNYTQNSGSFRYFVGGWSNLLQSNWRSSGYMLLVGETEVIPSFNITLTIPGNQYEIPLCDQPYSDLNDDGYRDLAFGRIIGNDATKLIIPIQTSRGVLNNFSGYEYEADNGLLISGVGNYYTTFIGNINFISNTMNNYIPPMANEKLHIINYVNDDDLYDQAHAQFLSMVPGKDIVYFNGHGYPGGWGDVLDYNDMPVNLGGVNPFVFAPTCSSGNYEIDEDDGIAETFLANGAGVYIGATRMSNTGTNDYAGRMFFRYIWRPYMNVGKPFRDLGRTLWSLNFQNPILRRWVLSYNLYGDPKYGPTPGSFDADLPLTGDDMDIRAVTEFSLDIPMYEVTEIEGVDHVNVEIPGGKFLSDPGQFVVPYWSEEVIIPAGQRVQDVTAFRSGFFAETGLLLPVAPDDFMESEDGEPFVPLEYDWFPDVPFRWNVIPDEDGGQTLVLMVYPFSYQGSTTNSHFYDHYDFSITMVSPSVEILGINLYRTEIRPGEELQGLIELHNTGDESLDIHFSAMVESYAGEQYTDGLSMRTLQVPPGHSTVVVYWDSEEIAEGYYKLKAIIEDSDVNRLDTASAQFTIDSEAVCSGDSDFDGDLDGIDLAEFIAIGDMDRIAEFADRFGTFCP